MKLKNKKTLLEWLSTGIIINVRNEETFALKKSFRTNYRKLILIFFIAMAALFCINTWLSYVVIIRWFNSEDDRIVLKRKILSLNLTLDSLKKEIIFQENYIKHLRAIINGEEANFDIQSNSVKKNESFSLDNASVELEKISPEDSFLRASFETENSKVQFVADDSKTILSEITFIQPAHGVITSEFDPEIKHFGLDIVAKKDEPIKSVADGTVLLATWTYEAGYTVVIQHKSNILSVYKHNSTVFKNVGDFVRQGEVIALMGNTGKYTTGPHLHFEIWINGNPINPKKLINL